MRVVLSAICLVFLAGCGGGSDAEVAAVQVANEISEKLARDGSIGFTGTASYLVRDTIANRNTFSAAQTVQVSVSGTAGLETLRLQALGNDVQFTNSNLNSAGTEYSVALPDGVTTVYLWTFFDDWDSIKNGTASYDYLVAFGASDYDTITRVNDRLAGVMGLETTAANMPQTGTASYSGSMLGRSYSVNNATTNNVISGDVGLTVSFANSTLQGRVSNIVSGTNAVPVNDILIVPTTISGNSFDTTLTQDCSVNCDTLTSTLLSGGFYGPNAEEVGARFEVNGIVSGGVAGTDDYLVVGVIAGSRN